MLPGATGSFSTGLICGAAAVAAGMSPLASMAIAAFGYAGTAQLVVVQLATTGATLIVLSLAGLVVNLRYAMFSLSMSRYLTGLNFRQRLVAAFFLTDPAFALSVARFTQHPDEGHRYAFYMGATLAMGAGWFIGVALGTALGATMPASWQIEYCVPLTFLAMVVMVVRDRPTAIAAAVSGITALLAVNLPYRAGLLAAATLGIVAGYLAESWQRR
ncbi:MAG: branched-chain amino acid ABC transporter permease [Betaproteobacteria bacterium]|nr:branched-chain amino acid ABC transporter permease [Betaproteobacteria bacterium]